jgi:purine-nucleoside phosphorylase
VTARLPHGDLAIIFGSGLAVVPDGAEVIDEIDYGELGWPATSVAGHANRLLLARWAPDGRTGLCVLLACGRPHLYEGWSVAELSRPVDDLTDRGVRALLVTNASGTLDPTLAAGTAVVVTQVVDLQGEPADEPPVLAVTDSASARRLGAALAPSLPARPGRYVAVPGPHYETPAEAAWLRGYGDVVGMSTAAEVRAANRRGVPVCVLSLVANASGAALDHAEVLAGGALLASGLRGGLGPLVAAFMAGLAPAPAGRRAPGGDPA